MQTEAEGAASQVHASIEDCDGILVCERGYVSEFVFHTTQRQGNNEEEKKIDRAQLLR